MKKYFQLVLMAAVVCGLSLGVVSCKDDDKNDNGSNMEQAESTGGDMTLAESQLVSLISSFGGIEAQEQLAQSGWKSKTYEATVGYDLDPSRPNVRTIEVGTVEAADEQAALLLDALGIDTNNPSGFTFQNAEVGTVSYQHGGDDANTLATINISVPQLRNIVQLKMVRQYPTNAGATAPRYRFGDIIMKDNRLWICTNPANASGQQAYFVTFWTEHSTGTCSWGKENDIVYSASQPMANSSSLATWMAQFLFSDYFYNEIINRLDGKGKDEHINEIIPATKEMRERLVGSLMIDAEEEQFFEALSCPEGITEYTWEKKRDNGRIVAPHGMMLCDIFRWSMGFTYDYWVPQLCWVSSSDLQTITDDLNALPSQSSKYFQWSDFGKLTTNSEQLTKLLIDSVHILKVATHWQHKYFTLDNASNQWAMFDFTKDWGSRIVESNPYSKEEEYWTRRNITSSQLVYTDKGKAMKNVEEVWVQLEDGNADVPILKNKNNDQQSNYAIGDVVEDDEGSRWICIFGAPDGVRAKPNVRTAWFVSFDNIKLRDGLPTNIVTEEDVTDLGVRFITGLALLPPDYKPLWRQKRGPLWEHVKEHTGLDFNDLIVGRDSTWTFTTKGNTYASKSTSYFLNMAYIGTDGQIYVMRVILDDTHVGTQRASAPKTHQDHKFCLYKQYQAYVPDQIQLTDADIALGMTKYNGVWPVTGEKMAYEHLYDNGKVQAAVKDDKWVPLPWEGETQRHIPTMTASANNDFNRFLPDRLTGQFPADHMGMFDEPVLVVRLMKVTDNGGKIPNILSQDGRRLTKVHVQDLRNYYRGELNDVSYLNFKAFLDAIFVDNELYQMKPE